MFKQFRPLKQGEFILAFMDTAGEGRDWCAAQFLSVDSLDIPIVLHYEGSIVDATPEMKLKLNSIYDQTKVKPLVAYETNNGGGYELERLLRLNRDEKYSIYTQKAPDAEGRVADTEKLGWNTNAATRKRMMIDLKDLVDNQLVRIYDNETISQMFSFVKIQKGNTWKAQAEDGAHDDLILALAGVWQMYQTEDKPKVKQRRRPAREKLRLHI